MSNGGDFPFSRHAKHPEAITRGMDSLHAILMERARNAFGYLHEFATSNGRRLSDGSFMTIQDTNTRLIRPTDAEGYGAEWDQYFTAFWDLMGRPFWQRSPDELARLMLLMGWAVGRLAPTVPDLAELEDLSDFDPAEFSTDKGDA